MRTAALHAVTAGLASLLALTGATFSSAQLRTRAEADNGYTARSCMPTNARDSADDLAAYCEGWRAVRKGF